MSDELVELAQQVYSGKIDLLCSRIVARSRCGKAVNVLCGNGIVRSGSDAVLSVDFVGDVADVSHSALRRDRKPGEFYAEQDYVDLQLRDSKGTEWLVERVVVSGEAFFFPATCVQFNLDVPTIHSTVSAALADGEAIRFVMRKTARLPMHGTLKYREDGDDGHFVMGFKKAHQMVKVREVSVRVESVGECISVRLTSKTPIDRKWVQAVCIALELMTSSPWEPVVVRYESVGKQTTVIHSGPYRNFKSRMPGPLGYETLEKHVNFWSFAQPLIGFFYDDVANDGANAQDVSFVRNGSTGGFSTACLTLSIAIEALAKRLLSDAFGNPVSQADIDDLIKHMSSWKGSDRLRQRASGKLRDLGGVRPLDALREWAINANIDDRLVKAWQRIRNPAAHGSTLREDQQSYDLYYCMAELYYRIFAWKVGYCGPLSAFSQRGWPRVSRPSDSSDGS